MSSSFSADQIGVAVASFLVVMRQEFVARHGVDADCRVPSWSSLSLEDRAVLVRAMRRALTAASSAEAVRRFREIQSEAEDLNEG